MKIRRFIASDMRQAIRQVREELGPDAVILSNKSTAEGVELTAAIDFDEGRMEQQVTQSQHKTAGKGQEAQPGAPTGRRNVQRREAPLSQLDQAATLRSQQQRRRPAGRSEPVLDDALAQMREEMQAMRRLMEGQLNELTWRDMSQRRPELRELHERLTQLGLSSDLVSNLVERVSESESFEQAWRKAQYFLSAEIAVTGDDLAEHGGVVAVIGPTGVGKTTTIAKLAARYCLRHGNRQVALISTDNFRIGAREQLHTYGRILNVPVRNAANSEELEQVLEQFSDRSLILIDTAGMSQRDVRISEQLAMLEVNGQPIRRLLTLSATTEQAALERAVQAFGQVRPDGCLLTKVDEAASLGGALSAIIHSGLPLAYFTDGQRVPEDLHVARANPLVAQAAGLAQELGTEQGDDYLAETRRSAAAQAYL